VHKPTRLASGAFNEQRLTVELVQPSAAQPASVRSNWPPLATVSSPAQFDAVVATVMRTLSSAVIELAAMRAAGKL
jgi:hypothetical protein